MVVYLSLQSSHLELLCHAEVVDKLVELLGRVKLGDAFEGIYQLRLGPVPLLDRLHLVGYLLGGDDGPLAYGHDGVLLVKPAERRGLTSFNRFQLSCPL